MKNPATRETFDESTENELSSRRSNYAEYRARKHPQKKKERISRANKIFLIDIAVIAFFGMMIFLFRPYLISPNKIGDWKFSASASVTEKEWIQVIVTAKPVSGKKPDRPPSIRILLFYEGSEWITDNLFNDENSLPTEDGFQWILLPFPFSQTEKISVQIESENEKTELITDIIG